MRDGKKIDTCGAAAPPIDIGPLPTPATPAPDLFAQLERLAATANRIADERNVLRAALCDVVENWSHMSDRSDGTQSKDQQRAWENARDALSKAGA